MAYFQPITVAFDDGNTVEIQTSSRDMLALEKDGVDLAGLGNIEAGYRIAHVTLQRYARLDRLDFPCPATWEALADVADLIPVDGADAEGEGLGQDQSTG